MGKLFIVEGIDGSGKTTQISALKQRLQQENKRVMQIKFPMYDQPSSALIRMYLAGEFGSHPQDVNAYAASAFYAVDRYASYKKFWGRFYQDGGVIISDRYVTSNMIHQGSKLPPEQVPAFFEWLCDFEYHRLGLPQPDRVFFLDVPPQVSVRQVEHRYQGDEQKKDIHEKDLAYLQKCYEMGIFACEKGFMTRIECVQSGKMKSVQQINDILYNEVLTAFC